MTYGTASSLKIIFWNCGRHSWNIGFPLNDEAQGVDIIFLVETWNMEPSIYLILIDTSRLKYLGLSKHKRYLACCHIPHIEFKNNDL